MPVVQDPNNGNFRLFPDGSFQFSSNGGPLGINLQELDDVLKAELISDQYKDQSVVYYALAHFRDSNLEVLTLPDFVRTALGEFGEFDFDVTGVYRDPNSDRSQPALLLRLRTTKIGQAESWKDFLEKIAKLQGLYGLAQLGTCLSHIHP